MKLTKRVKRIKQNDFKETGAKARHIRDYYSNRENARAYDATRFTGGGAVIDEAEKKAVAEALRPKRGMKIVDVASGTGRFARLLASRGASVTAFDYSKEMLELSRQIALREGFRLRFARGDAAETGLRENAFDAASCMRFFIHVEKPAAYLRELARVTRGPIVFDTVNSRSLKFFQAVFVNAFKKTLGYSYMSVFSENEVCGEVERAGLTVAEVRKEFFFPQAVYRFLPFPLARELKKFDDALLRLTGGRLACAHYWKTRKNEKTGKK